MRRLLMTLVGVCLAATATAQTRVVTADAVRLLSDGAAATPAITWQSDQNMGLFRSTTDVLALVTAGTARLTIDASGYVGVGTAAPTMQLDLVGASNAGVRLKQGSQVQATAGAFYSGLTFENTDTLHAFAVGYQSGLKWGVNYYDTSTYATLLTVDSTATNPGAHWTYDLGADATRWRSLYAAELNVWRLVAKDVIASVGGEIWTSETTSLSAALGSGAGDTTLTVVHNFLEDGDFVILKDLTNLEVLEVDSSAGGSAGAYTYTVVRDKDGSGRNAWAAGVAAVNTGKAAGEGLISQYAAAATVDTLLGGSPPTLVGPAMAGITRTGTTWNNLALRWIVGNLNGSYDYGANNVYGFAAGDAAETWVSIDATNGFRVMHGSTAKVEIDETGSASFTGSVTAESGTIGGWSISATTLTAGSGSSIVGLNTSDSVGIFAGAAYADRGTAPFRVLNNGAMYTGRSYFGSTTGMDVEVGHSGNVNIVRALDGTTERVNFWWAPDGPYGARITMPYSSKAAGYSAGETLIFNGDGMTTFEVQTNIDASTNYANFKFGSGLQLWGGTAPTGGDKGVGTINVSGGYYVGGSLLVSFPQPSVASTDCDGSYVMTGIDVNGDSLVSGINCTSIPTVGEVAALRAEVDALKTVVLDLLARIAALEGARR